MLVELIIYKAPYEIPLKVRQKLSLWGTKKVIKKLKIAPLQGTKKVIKKIENCPLKRAKKLIKKLNIVTFLSPWMNKNNITTE